jgi:dUTP pyrophosphatase
MTDSTFKSNTVGVFISDPHIRPRRKTADSAGYDFIAPQTVIIPAHKFIQFDTGVKVQMRKGFLLKLFIRSSLGKKGITLTNAVGIIDSDFRDSMQAMLMNNSDEDYTIYKGERYMQGIFERYFVTDDDDATGVRKGGLGSTGK